MSRLTSILDRCRTSPPNILATLQAVQAELGYVDPKGVPAIAHALGVTDSDVRGVLSFYHDLRTEPPGRHVIRFCLGDSCVATRCEASLAALEEKLHVKLGGTTKDGKFTLDKVYCLGNCALSPSVMIDGEVHGKFTPKTIASLLKGCK